MYPRRENKMHRNLKICEKARDTASVVNTLPELFGYEWDMKGVRITNMGTGIKLSNLISSYNVNNGILPNIRIKLSGQTVSEGYK
jgi:hypothetical protein